MKVMYYLERSGNTPGFDEVNEFCFINMKFAVTDDGKPRYTGNYFKVDGAVFTMQLKAVTLPLLTIMARILALQPATGSNPNGWVKEPDMVKFHKGTSTFYYRPATGETLIVKKMEAKAA